MNDLHCRSVDSLSGVRQFIVFRVGVVLLVVFFIGCADTTGRLAAYFENRAIDKAARHYLDAEVKRDYKVIYESLAPSSVYCASNTYEMYLAQAKNSPVIASYKIVRISNVRVNDDPQRYPKVEKFAQVEVDLVLVYKEAGQKTEVNFAFPFIKEGGAWYKG